MGEEEDGGKEEDSNVREILDKYLPLLLEREGAGIKQAEGNCGGDSEGGEGEGGEVENNSNQEELEDGVESVETVENQVEEKEISGENREDESTEMVIDKEDISEEKIAGEGGEIMASREDVCEEDTKSKRVLAVICKEEFVEE